MHETRPSSSSKVTSGKWKSFQRMWRNFRNSESFIYSQATLTMLVFIVWYWSLTKGSVELSPHTTWKSVIPPLEGLGPEFPQGRVFKKQHTEGVSQSRTRPQNGRFESVGVIPHDSTAFTQGLAFYEDKQYETTGLYGRSELRELDLATGKVVRRVSQPDDVFGEGLVVVNDVAYVLTWQNHLLLRYDIHTFTQLYSSPLHTEGWGLTYDSAADQLVLSDGSSKQYWLDKDDATVKRQVTVRKFNGKDFSAVNYLNELEFVYPYVLAHRWFDDAVYVIHADSGQVKQIIDGTHLFPDTHERHSEMSFNGLAARPVPTKSLHTMQDGQNQSLQLFVTGKLWPVMHQVTIDLK